MTKTEQMRNEVIEQTQRLGIEDDLVDDYLAASDKARHTIRRIAWGQIFAGDVATANDRTERYMGILGGLRELYRLELDSMAIR